MCDYFCSICEYFGRTAHTPNNSCWFRFVLWCGMPSTQGLRRPQPLWERIGATAVVQRWHQQKQFVLSRLERRGPWSSVGAVGAQQPHRLLYTTTRKDASSWWWSSSGQQQQLLHIAPNIRQALQQQGRRRRPVVALESTIVAHGMPYPQNYELSLQLHALLRDKGVEPATIGTYIYMRERVCVCISVPR
jgi:aspartate/tyrosine/aromatic aminotransferase